MKNKKLWIVIGIVVAIGIITLGTLKNRQQNRTSNVIKIGAILPLTGQFSTLGKDSYDGIFGAVNLVNKNGGVLGHQIEVIFEDSKGEPKVGIAKYQKLRDTDKVDFIICGLSHVSKAIIPSAEKDKRIVISTIASASKFADISPWLFRIFTSSDVETKVAADFIVSKLQKYNIALLREDSDSGNDASRLFTDAVEKLGGKVVLDEIPESSQEYVNLLAKLNAANYDAIYVYCGDIRLGTLVKTASLSQRIVPIVTLPIINNEPIKKQLEGLNLPHIFYPNLETTPEYNMYLKPNISTVFGYSIVMLLSEAIKRANSLDNEKVRESFLELKDVEGAISGMTITPQGDVIFPMTIREFSL